MVTVKCDMCGKDIANNERQSSYSIPHEIGCSYYDICEECSNKVEEFIKATKKDQIKCDKVKCEGCKSFTYTSSVIQPNKLHVRCNKINEFAVVDLEHIVKPEDFYEEEK